MLAEKGLKLDAVVELKVDEGRLLARIEIAHRGNAGARASRCARTTIRRSCKTRLDAYRARPRR